MGWCGFAKSTCRLANALGHLIVKKTDFFASASKYAHFESVDEKSFNAMFYIYFLDNSSHAFM
jgi:hypothetical protein